ncbi:DUF1345 domain-containing protein [Hymenobacter sp. H14-R3]|uniref:DUF1345 domain-containing protein n=1 Tax=Hymenobacter sp. H14-R3 TaxID=3046308 RepID=UPI0024BA7431|nr:DUF1345 domain-containing protein [Hymenobacter sp. H14-R3]MDJ0364322.1 DUF1345 domain-containing protein [Hymenobacter sp. H14-R3]
MKKTDTSASLWHRLGHLPATLRLAAGSVVGAAAWAFSPAHYSGLIRLIISWDAFAITALALIWLGMNMADAARIRAIAAKEDLSRLLSFVFVLVAAAASLLAVVLLLSTTHSLPPGQLASHIALSGVAVATSWLLVHTVFTLRYAHIYYDAGPDGNDVGGLDFPGDEKEPDYLDIAYFAFVVGMTAQTADVAISSRGLRRLALLHGLISFVFNTALVALVINGVAGIL